MTPTTFHGKKFLQQLWKFGYDWDKLLSQEHQEKWSNIIQGVDGFQCHIDREVAQIDETTNLVVFSDASKEGMAACAYLSTDDSSSLMVGKSKLPSIKENPTIPKLDLNALTLAVRLAHSVYQAVKAPTRIQHVVILCDSEIALAWTSSFPVEPTAGILVRNRVHEIRKLTAEFQAPVRFRYVNTTENPADCATRGVTTVELLSHLWWAGPPFIRQKIDNCPIECPLFSLPEDDDENEVYVSTADSKEFFSDLLDQERHHKHTRAQNVIAFVLCFLRAMLAKTSDQLRKKVANGVPELRDMKAFPYVTAHEREMAMTVLVRNHQNVHLPIAKQTALKQLKLKKDEHGILRCQGRLGNANLPINTR
ncbi:hypothetical protein ANCCEY_12266 [Ancylostoma ceylanicum]|uniref:Pao retrotransposon peptidase n=2 Tax=Ancylostoma ceylanicum TaxID=53326 RepID=A0A0D6LLX5_9BILA|nr:hypothetical protein ANCCEY_12266 [Ancylostoma ceylanicum]EYC03937.1 hypothetical protein Y032_0091g2510 [Ancylostoma ceylanicum]